MFTLVTELTFASNELFARRGSTFTSSSLILRNGMLEDWKTNNYPHQGIYPSGKQLQLPSFLQDLAEVVLEIPTVTGDSGFNVSYLLVGFREGLWCRCCFLVFWCLHISVFLFIFWFISFSLSIGTCMNHSRKKLLILERKNLFTFFPLYKPQFVNVMLMEWRWNSVNSVTHWSSNL